MSSPQRPTRRRGPPSVRSARARARAEHMQEHCTRRRPHGRRAYRSSETRRRSSKRSHLDKECATSCPALLTMTEAITKGVAKATTPHKVEFSKESDSDKSERENLKRKISQLENENLLLKKQNTKSKTLIEGLRKENVRLNEKFLKTVLEEKLPTSVMNYITSFNKSVYKNRLSVQFGFPPEEQWNGNFNAILKFHLTNDFNEEWRRQQNFQLTYRLNAFEHNHKQLLPFDMGLTMNFQNWDIKWDLKTFEVMVVFQCDKNIKLLDTTKCEVTFFNAS